MCCKAAKTACNINNAFGPGTAKECTVQWWLKKFCKENLEDECSSQPLEVDDNWEPPLKLILLDNHSRSCWRTQSRPFCGRLAFEANWKNLDKWMPHELTENLKKKITLKCRLLLFYTTMTISWSDCEMWWKVDFFTASGNDQLSGWTEKTLQSQTCTRKWSWSLLGDLLLIWCTIAFWILVKPLHLRSMLSKSMRCPQNCNACSWHWSTEWAQFFFTIMPDCMSHNQHFRSWMNWSMRLCLIHHFYLTPHQLTTTS